MTISQNSDRSEAIYCSEIPILAMASPWGSPAAVVASKLERLKVAATPAMDSGNFFEGGLLDWYDCEHQTTVIRPADKDYICPEYPHLIGHPDAIHRTQAGYIGVEAKYSSRPSRWYGDAGIQVPPDIVMQCQALMLVTQFREWRVWALVGHPPPKVFQIHADRQKQKAILALAKHYWDLVRQAQEGVWCPMTSPIPGSPQERKKLMMACWDRTPKPVEAVPISDQAAEAYLAAKDALKQAKDQVKEFEDAYDEACTRIAQELHGAQRGRFSSGYIVEPRKIDVAPRYQKGYSYYRLIAKKGKDNE